MRLTIVIPTINRADLLAELLESLHWQRDQYFNLMIIDNGNQGIKLPEYMDCVIYHPVKNLGVSGSWNTGAVSAIGQTDWILFLNDDINLAKDQLVKIVEVLENNPNKWLVVGPYYWSVMALNMKCVEYLMQNEGYVFDEKFYPAYFEDNDFDRRIKLIDPNLILNPCEEMLPETRRNSMTIEKQPELNMNFDANKKYYISKWGGEPGQEKFSRPFNK